MQENDVKFKKALQAMTEALLDNKFDEAWQPAGELNAMLKSKETLSIPHIVLDNLGYKLRFYYRSNEDIKKAHRQQKAIGHDLEELCNMLK